MQAGAQFLRTGLGGDSRVPFIAGCQPRESVVSHWIQFQAAENPASVRRQVQDAACAILASVRWPLLSLATLEALEAGLVAFVARAVDFPTHPANQPTHVKLTKRPLSFGTPGKSTRLFGKAVPANGAFSQTVAERCKGVACCEFVCCNFE